MKGPHYLVFAMSSSRTDDAVVEEVKNALDEYLEDEWEIVVWRRSSGTRFIVRATVQARMIRADDELKIRLMTMSHMLDEMQEPNIEWIIPRKAKTGTVAEMARRTVDRWLEALWPTEVDPDGNTVEPEEEEEAEEKPKPPVKTFSKRSPESEVLSAFGLEGSETDSEGAPLGLFVINKGTA